MSNATEYLVYREIAKKVKYEHGPHHYWLRLIRFDSTKFTKEDIKKWLRFNGFDHRVVNKGQFNGYSWVDVDNFPLQPAHSVAQEAEKGVFFQWAVVPEGGLTVNVPYSYT